MDADRVEKIIRDYAALYPSLITIEQAAEIAVVPEGTVYAWSSFGHFDGYKAKRGRFVRLDRDEFVRFLVSRAD